MMDHPTVAHVTVTNESPDNSLTKTIERMVDHVQAIHLDPFDVLLGTIYNRSLLDEINENWDIDPLTSDVSLSSTGTTETDGIRLYNAQYTDQVKDVPKDW
jgi:hypothetical protein